MPADRKSPTKAKKPASPRKKLKPELLEVSLAPPPSPVVYGSPVVNPLFHNILLKTLGHALAKNIDWHEMSKAIASEMETSTTEDAEFTPKGRGKAKAKGKAKQTEEGEGDEAQEQQQQQKKKGEMTGLELHDHFHHTIYPALKAGVPIWLSKIEPPSVSPANSVGSIDHVADAMEEDVDQLEDEE